jgi:ABC-type transport system substrate-binding protein
VKTRRSTKLFATVAAASLVLAACGGDDDTTGDTGTTDVSDDTSDQATSEPSADTGDSMSEDTGDTGSEPAESTDSGGEPTGEPIGFGTAQEFSNYNNNLASSNSSKNTLVLNQVLPWTFNFAGPSGNLVMDDELLDSATVVSEDPLVVEYVFNADAAWSDGEPIGCYDMYFFWAANNGQYLQLDDAGNPVVDPETESEIPLFEAAGSSGYEDIGSVDCSEDGKTVTTNFDNIYADWQGLFGPLMPAHVVAREAGVDDAIAAFQNDDRAAIEAMADFYNNGWTVNPGEIKPDIMPSGSRYMLDSWEAGSSLTLVPNPNYWGTPANGPIVYRLIAEEAQAQALANGEINTMNPQPSVDLLAQLEGIDNAVIETGSQFLWEHFDFNFLTPALQDRNVREAFALCLPRQQMVQNLIQPLDPTAQVLNNRYNRTFEDSYQDTSGGLYDAVDLEKAQGLLDASGVEQPVTLRLGWFDNGGNQRRTDQVALTLESCNSIGFDIVDAGSETFFDVELDAGDWDIAMFGWRGSALKTGSSEVYKTDGGINFGHYSNTEVDGLIEQVNSTPDAAAQAELGNQIDAILWEDLATIPVFDAPGVAAWSDNVENVINNPGQSGLTFNAAQWQIV